MALVALHRLYQRTWQDCGSHWTVTRAQKQISVRQPVLRQRGIENARGALVETRERQIDPLRECAKCGGFGSPNGQSRSAVPLTPRSNRTYHLRTPGLGVPLWECLTRPLVEDQICGSKILFQMCERRSSRDKQYGRSLV
jgi:hypothetical protein